MALTRIRIEGVRCIAQAELALHPQRNYFFGPNGAGKTSLLEAVFLLGRGRSFRTRQLRQLVKRGQSGLAVFGECSQGADGVTQAVSHRLGVGYDGNGLDIRVDGAGGRGLLDLSATLGVQAIGPGLHQLVEGGPGERRRFLDWGVFHVEHGYLSAWRNYRRVLSQRNAVLKRSGGASGALDPWSVALVEAGEAVDRARAAYVAQLSEQVSRIGTALLGEPVAVKYRSGWREGLDLGGALRESAETEVRMGVTQVGPHRADLAIGTAAGSVRDSASRGQQKLVAATLLLAQARVGAASGAGEVLLVDDPAAELDAGARARLNEELVGTGAQLLITGLSREQLDPAPGFPVFHVEQGRITQVV